MRRGLTAAACVAALLAVCAGTAQAAQYDPSEVIVKYADGVSTAQRVALFGRTGVVKTLGSVDGVGAKVVSVDGDPQAVAARLNRSSLVQYAEPNLLLRAQAIPNDARFGELYGLNNPGQAGGTPDADIDAPEGWDAAGLGTFPAAGGVRIGIVDTGIDQAHPDLAGQTVACARSQGVLPIMGGTIQVGSCADDNDHGSHVAGTIAANANNGAGVAGVAFNSDLVVCKALGGPLGTGSTADVANCINWVHSQGAKVISMSLGGGDSTTLRNAVVNAWKNGAANGSVVIAAAGNDGDATLNYPAAYAEVVSVAATDSRDARASFSNANADVEIAAPGVNVLSTVRGGGYAAFSGTSMATPHVAAVAGVLRQLFPSETAAAIRARLTAAVDDLGPAGRDASFGFGRVNLCKAAGGAC
ncbi:MAG: serine protease [Thermoleophilaceae bacterium]|nr:serine protease [Thermoleophilaceae bacterium]